MLENLIARQRSRAVEAINRLLPWYRLPTWLGLANLSELRKTLRAENLHDTSRIDTDGGHEHASIPLKRSRIRGALRPDRRR